MTISQSLIGQRLKEARENSRMTQEAVAENLGLPRTAVVQIEAGNRSVSTMELVRFAELFKRPILEFFTESAKGGEDILVALFRAVPEIRDNPDLKAKVEQCLDLCREGAVLEDMLGWSHRSGPPGYQLPAPQRSADAVQQGSETADAERKRLDLGDGPIANIVDMIASQGVWAASLNLPDAMSGLFLNDPSFGCSILVNEGHWPTRRRFSYAHEYAHALLDRNLTVTVSSQDNRAELAEVRANAFAASFLLPAEGVRRFLETLDKARGSRVEEDVYDVLSEGTGAEPIRVHSRSAPGASKITYQDAAQLARCFGVSYQAAVYRLKSLRWINQAECEALIALNDEARAYLKLLGFKGEQSAADERDPELTSSLLYLAVEAFRRGQIARGRLLEIGQKLGFQADDLLQLAQAAVEE